MLREGNGFSRGLVLAAALIGCLVLPAAAAATTRYAAPGGTATPAQCQSPSGPFCSIGAAAGGTGVVAADEAVILPGNYSDTAGDLDGDAGNPTDHVVQPTAGTVRGESVQNKPVITLTTNVFYGAFLISNGSTVSDVEINNTGPSFAAVSVFGGTMDRVIARSNKDNGITCQHTGGLIRNSACLASGSGGSGVGQSTLSGGTFNLKLRGVTAISTGTSGYGLSYNAFGTGYVVNVDVRNTIARGPTKDVRAAGLSQSPHTAGTAGAVHISLDFSNYTSEEEAFDAGGTAANATVTNPGTANNETAGLALASDNIHQLPTSTGTINQGSLDASSGSEDIDGQNRQCCGLAPTDIGADEAVVSTTTTVSCDPNPDVVTTPTTCTATVDGSAGADVVTGSVSFAAGSGTFSNGGTCTLPGGPQITKQCQVTYTPSSLGSQSITASYSGDGFHDASQGSTSVTATTAPTTTTVTCSPASLLVNTATACTATVASTLPGASGTLSFASDAAGTFGGGAACTLSGGQCQVSYTPSGVGPHQVIASFGGDTNHDPSSGTTAVTANAPPGNVTPPGAKKKCKKKKHKRAASAAKKKCKKKKKR